MPPMPMHARVACCFSHNSNIIVPTISYGQVPSLDLGSSTAILMLGGYLRTRMRTGNQATRGYVLSRRDCQKCRVYRVGEPSSSCGPKGLPIETVCSLTHEEVIGNIPQLSWSRLNGHWYQMGIQKKKRDREERKVRTREADCV